MKDARAIVGTRMLIGVSTHNIEQARAAVLDGANYLGAGPTFPSQTKDVRRIRRTGLPAAGRRRNSPADIRHRRHHGRKLADVLATGITRVAVGAAVTAADKPACAARELLDMLNDVERTRDRRTRPAPVSDPRPSTSRPLLMLHAIIMAGGTGTRFWPASTNDTPKQLLRLVGDATMLRQTVDRLGDLVPNERRMIVTNERLVDGGARAVAGAAGGGDRRRAVQARHGAVHRPGRAAW